MKMPPGVLEHLLPHGDVARAAVPQLAAQLAEVPSLQDSSNAALGAHLAGDRRLLLLRQLVLRRVGGLPGVDGTKIAGDPPNGKDFLDTGRHHGVLRRLLVLPVRRSRLVGGRRLLRRLLAVLNKQFEVFLRIEKSEGCPTVECGHASVAQIVFFLIVHDLPGAPPHSSRPEMVNICLLLACIIFACWKTPHPSLHPLMLHHSHQ